MPIAKVQFKPGINKEITVYANEGGWVNCNNVRFRTGFPEKLGGWVNYSPNYTFNGTARTMFNWVDYSNNNLLGFGTNQKYYVENGGQYYDITPNAPYQVNYLGVTTGTTLGNNPFNFPNSSIGYEVVVTDASFDSTVGTFVTFSGATAFGGFNANGTFEIVQVLSSTTYVIVAPAGVTGPLSGGGNSVVAVYDINAGSCVQSSGSGWGIGPFGEGGWGTIATTGIPLQLWSEANFNQDLVMAVRTGPIYYWQNSVGTYTPAITINQYANNQIKTTQTFSWTGSTNTINTSGTTLQIDIGAYVTGPGIQTGTYVTFAGGTTVTLSMSTTGTQTNVSLNFSYAGQTAPTETFQIINWQTYQFIIALGSTPYNPANFNPAFSPMTVRWTDQSLAQEWTPTTYNQAGESILGSGSFIIGGIATRQEVLIWTDSTLYSMQYIGPPYTFGFTALMDNVSLMSPNAMATVNGVTYWMGVDKFYVYSGTVNTLPSTLRKFVFNNINLTQAYQTVCGVNEQYNEIWWHYPSNGSNINNSYVIYNYMENIWYYGSMNRTAWEGSPLRPYPMAIYSCQNTYLANQMLSTDTSCTVLNASSYPPSGYLQIGSEQMSYTSLVNNTFSGITRAVNGYGPLTWYAYTPVNNLIPNQVVYHESGVDDQTWPSTGPHGSSGQPVTGPMPINSYLESADFAIGDGHHYAYVWRCLPDFEFNIGQTNGSTALNPQILLTVYPRQNSGTTYQTNVDSPSIVGTSSSPVEQFTGQIYTRVRGRQMAMQINSPNLGVFWQMGSMRFDIRPDGRR